MAADKTAGFKLSEDEYNHVQSLIQMSGVGPGEWFRKAVTIMELQGLKDGANEYTQELKELEVHTNRIYELISNMLQRSIYIKDSEVKEYSDKLEKKEIQLVEIQDKIRKAVETEKEAREYAAQVEKANDDLLRQLADLRSTNESNSLLNNEFKEKIDTLSGLVNKYQAFADENEVLKQKYAEDTERMKSSIQEYKETVHDLQATVNQLTGQIDSMKRDHDIALERIEERKDTEKERAVIEIERDYQARLLAANEDYNGKLRESYAEITALRNQYEERIEKLQQPKEQPKDKK